MTDITALKPLGVLTYAHPGVKISPPRTTMRMIGAALGRGRRLVLAGLRLVVLAVGYAMLGAGIGLRFAFALIAVVLLFVGGLRWDVVKRRTLVTATWVDAKVLDTISFVRRQVDRLPPHRRDGSVVAR
jgi:hypothetical protein